MSGGNDIVVRAAGLSKVYRVYRAHGRGWIASVLMPWVPRDRFSKEVVALRDVSFELRRGEVLGIVGRNGAGKSTLLKLVAGLARPTSGSIEVHGRIRALLSLGVGFHPRFTGRQNILFGSMAMGIPRRVALARTQEIIDFAELGEHIDMPMQFYSAGMQARLAAAVAFQESPEVLIIDEALAAGDGYFIGKCLQRISEICNSGTTALFVSHGADLIERLCHRAIIVDQGRVTADGAAGEVVAGYRQMLARQLEDQVQARAHSGAGTAGEDWITSGRGTIRLLEACMVDERGRANRVFAHGRALELRLTIEARERIPVARFFIQLMSGDYGVKLAELGSDHVSVDTGDVAHLFLKDIQGVYRLHMRWPSNPLGGGAYHWNASFAPLSTELPYESPARYHLHVERLCPFRSISYPGHEWARHRRSILEPATTFELTPIRPAVLTQVPDAHVVPESA